MCTPLTHAVISAAAGGILGPRKKPRRFWLWVVVCGVVADVDSIGMRFGIPYEHLLGHRGLTHSLAFAVLVSVLVASLAFRDVGVFSGRWWRLLGLLAGIMAVHDCLDAMTDGGLGVAFFAPFDNGRYWLGWRPIPVAPIGLSRALSPWGWAVIRFEMLWLWAPAMLVWAASAAGRRGWAAWRSKRGPRAERDEHSH